MDEVQQYEQYLRERITALRSQNGVSEHRLSLELGKSGSYIRFLRQFWCPRGNHQQLGRPGAKHPGGSATPGIYRCATPCQWF